MAISLPWVVSAARGRVTLNSPHTREQRFTLHGLKHRGITDTKGKKAEKKEASGLKTDAMLDLYDHEVAVVEPAQSGEAEGVL
jgi:hypothetical protein